jgi:hypothetical protein
MSNSPSVDFFVNCYERDYKDTLAPGFMEKVRNEQAGANIRNWIVSVNNVNDLLDARQRAERAVNRREVDRVVFVADHLEEAMRRTGLTAADLGRVRHFTDWCIVQATCTDSDYICHQSADIRLTRPFNWIDDAVATLEKNPLALVANPYWEWDAEGARREAKYVDGHYFVSTGVCDSFYLAKRKVLDDKIYHEKHEYGNNFNLSWAGEVFEQRLDAYMRNHGLLRITDSRIGVIHTAPWGTAYPKFGLMDRLRRKLKKLFSRTK